MKPGIFAKTFAGIEPGRVLSASSAAGYSGVAYNMACSGLPSMPDEISDAVIGDIAEAIKTSGQEIFSLSATYNMAHPDPLVRDTGARRLAVIASVAKAIGTDLLTLCTGTRDAHDQWRGHVDNGSREAWRDMQTSFERAVDIAERFDIYLGVEPELANVISTTSKAKRLIDEMDSERLRIVLDPANQFETTTPGQQRALVEEAIDVLGDRIAMAHAKDRFPDGSFAAAGRGVVDFDHFVDALAKADFNGPLVAHGLSVDDAPEVARFLTAKIEAAEC